jgi:Fe-S oxidoreductase
MTYSPQRGPEMSPDYRDSAGGRMDQQELHLLEGQCIQEEPPACRAGCPLGVDGRAFAQAIARDDLAGARAILEKSMPLSGIVGRLCEAPCEGYCLRRDFGGAVALGGLERLCLSSIPARGKVLRLPSRGKNITVIGSAPSSLVVAFELAKKGYSLTLLYRPLGLGGWLRSLPEAELPAAVLAEELAVLDRLGVEFIASPELDSALLTAHGGDAVYVGQDDSVAADLQADLCGPDPITFALARPGFFTGGLAADHPYRLILSVSQGREAAVSIDRFLQGASLTASRVLLRNGRTDLFTETKDVLQEQRIIPSEPQGYSRTEGVAEAGRCLDCQCLECVKNCVYLAEYGAYPKVYARRVYNNSAIVKGIHQTNRFINGCTLCGQCETICPNDFSMAELCLDARRLMVRENRMPASAHWFALTEMRAAAGETALVRHAPGKTASQAIFFPGCQLAGIRPDQTFALYNRLLDRNAETGIWLDCCAAPARWAGREEEFKAMLAHLEGTWKDMGRPQVLAACSTCLQIFREHLPGIEIVSVWTLLAGTPLGLVTPHPTALALTDPCTSRHDQATRQAVRSLLSAMGQDLAPLAMSGELTECCGFGGLMDGADPGLARKVAAARVGQSDAAFLTYCAMCRDQLAKTGKGVLHLLDLLLPDCIHAADEPPASISARRAGRRKLKGDILAKYGATESVAHDPKGNLRLVISASVAALLEERRILEDDIRGVLLNAAGLGSSFVHNASGQRLASARLGEVTFWVSFRHIDRAYHIDRCWSHRMTIGRGDTP